MYTNSTNYVNISAAKCFISDMPLAPWRSLSSFTEAVKVSSIIAVTVNALTMPLTLFLNALVMFVVWKNESLQVERVIVLAYLALADFLVGLVCQPLYIAREMLQLQGFEVICSLVVVFYLSLGILKGAEFYQLVVITYERYVAIIHPYQYPTRITVKRLTYASIGLWTFNTISFFALFLTLVLDVTLYIDVLNSTLRIVISVCIFYFYAKIFGAIRKQKRQVGQQLQNVSINPRTRRNNKGAITSAILLGCFILSFFPILVLVIVSRIPGLISQDNSVRISLQQLIEVFILLVSFFNPIIYGLRTKQLRNSCFNALGFQRHDSNVNDEVVSQNAFVLQLQTFRITTDKNNEDNLNRTISDQWGEI